jgi:hypothetical protein
MDREIPYDDLHLLRIHYLFAGPEELIDQADDIQGDKIAYQPPDSVGSQ